MMASGRARESRLIVKEAKKTSGSAVGSQTILSPSTDLTDIGAPLAALAFRFNSSDRRSHDEVAEKIFRYTDVSSVVEMLR
jgi:hypothetical protein